MCCRFFLLPAAQAQRGPSHLKRLFTGVTEKIHEILLCSSKGTLHISGRVWFCQPVLTYRVFSAQYQNGMKFPSTFLWNLTIESWKITIIDVDIFMVILPLQFTNRSIYTLPHWRNPFEFYVKMLSWNLEPSSKVVEEKEALTLQKFLQLISNSIFKDPLYYAQWWWWLISALSNIMQQHGTSGNLLWKKVKHLT